MSGGKRERSVVGTHPWSLKDFDHRISSSPMQLGRFSVSLAVEGETVSALVVGIP